MTGEKLVVTEIVGGLGNQMFQYAAGRALSLRLGVPLTLDISAYERYVLHAFGLNHFAINAKLQKGRPKTLFDRFLRRMGWRTPPTVLREASMEVDPRFFALEGEVRLEGYWQSETYFSEVAEQLRKDFAFPPCSDPQNAEWFARIQADDRSISLHVRRGDYITNKQANAVHGTCGLDYYQRAIDHLAQRIGTDMRFYIISDDPAWTAENLKLPFDAFYISHNGPDKNYEDMRLMSACRHHVIANSSFSWWGAWLNPSKDKIVVAPQRWFQADHMSAKDLIPQTWVRL
ncbi:alpha-1,2-fucosyltransferase [Herbaspirillum sp.]|uniref:alpha-1,2-fucosyltransferase n=1 Tax=Herbaspirillum sp. TaxID=1890675 RepID=UPI0031D6AE7A